MESFLMEKANLKQIGEPVDGNTAAITGARVSMASGERLSIVVSMGDSTAALVSFSLKQHNAASGGTTKALSIDNAYFHKVGAATSFTKVEPTSATDAYDLSALFAGEPGVVVFEVLQENLDVQNNFSHVSIDIADTTAAKIISGLYLVGSTKNDPAYSTAL